MLINGHFGSIVCLIKGHVGGMVCLINGHVGGIECLIKEHVVEYCVFNYGTRWEVCCV